MPSPKADAKNIQLILKDLGHEIPLGHCYELIAKIQGHKSWNVASAKQEQEPVTFTGNNPNNPSYEILENERGEPLVIRDLDIGKSVTNGAEVVVEILMKADYLPLGRRLFYIDTMGNKDEILRDSGTGAFRGFKPGERLKPIDKEELEGKTLQEKAEIFLKYFETKKRGETKFLSLKNSRPDWMQDIVRECHGDMLPDDHKYEFVVEALEAIREADDPEEIHMEADIYTRDLLNWLTSSNTRTGYMDEAIENHGSFKQFDDHMMAAQSTEKDEILRILISELEKI